MTRRDDGIHIPSDLEGKEYVGRAGPLEVPRDVRLEGNRLVWNDRKTDTRDIRLAGFKAFLTLNSPNHVLAFAKAYGPLRLCDDHFLPHTHNLPAYRPVDDWSCDVSRHDEWTYSEPISEWLKYARAAASMVRIAGNVHQDQPSRDADWAILKRSRIKPVLITPHRTVAQSARLLTSFLNAWLDAADASLFLHWPKGAAYPTPTYRGGLFAALTIQISMTLTKSRNWPVCGYCWLPFFASKQIPSNETPCCGTDDCVRKKNARNQRNRRREK
jgi:hypothetical protein